MTIAGDVHDYSSRQSSPVLAYRGTRPHSISQLQPTSASRRTCHFLNKKNAEVKFNSPLFLFMDFLVLVAVCHWENEINELYRWWFQLKYFFKCSPYLGEMIQFDLRIFFNWVGKNHRFAKQASHDRNRKPVASGYGPFFAMFLCGSWFQTPHNSTWEVKLNMHMYILCYTYNIFIYTYVVLWTDLSFWI